MKFFSGLRSFAVIAVTLCSVSCGGDSSSDSTPQEVRAALVSSLGEDGAFTGLSKAIVKGYSLRQIVDAALAGRLQVSGDLQATDGSIMAPESAPAGTLRTLKLGAASIQVEIESSIVTISQDYLEQIGVEVNLDSITAPLVLAEEGYSATQISSITTRQDRLLQGSADRPVVLVDGTGLPIEALVARQNVLSLSEILGLPAPSPTPTEPGGSTGQASFLVSPTSASFTHRVGVTSCPQLVTTLQITNTADGTISLQITPDVPQLNVSASTLMLERNQSGNIDVNFNCSSAQPFTGHIPVVGRLFQNGQASGDEVTTIILITPTIIKD